MLDEPIRVALRLQDDLWAGPEPSHRRLHLARLMGRIRELRLSLRPDRFVPYRLPRGHGGERQV